MSKIGAAAVLAVAAIAGSASAQECAPEFGDASRCHGITEAEHRVCCEGLECQKKDEWYGQCRPIGMTIPNGWDGTILNYSTKTEEVAATPVAVTVSTLTAGDDTFLAVTGKDYNPAAQGTKLVMVEDVTPMSVAGNLVANQQACANVCAANEVCTAASYYLTNVGSNNCWLKIMAESCELPPDADDDNNAVLLVKLSDTCKEEITAGGNFLGALGLPDLEKEATSTASEVGAMTTDSAAADAEGAAEAEVAADAEGAAEAEVAADAEGAAEAEVAAEAEGVTVSDAAADAEAEAEGTAITTDDLEELEDTLAAEDRVVDLVDVAEETGTTTVADTVNGAVSVRTAAAALAVAGAVALF